MTQLVPWVGPAGVAIPPMALNPDQIVPYAEGLKPPERIRVTSALEGGFYDMGAEFVWRRAMTRLRQTVAGLGMAFVAEMLGRDDLDSGSSAEAVLTDVDTIRLAEQLGVISQTGALKLRQAFETLSHHARAEVNEELSFPEAVVILRTCVQYALGEKDMQVAVDFSRFRDDLLSRTLGATDLQIEQLSGSPPFFISTAVRTLLASVKTEKGARLQHALENINVVLPAVWPRLPEQDRWAVGNTYAEESASGHTTAVADLKRALLKVAGFDYVPENLRSNTYRKAAQQVIDAHFSFGNFDAEISPTRHLASLGTIIPKPAVRDCVRAYLFVYLGNRYGHSWGAAPIAKEQLLKLGSTTWDYFFELALPSDLQLLVTLSEEKPATRFVDLLPELQLQHGASAIPGAFGKPLRGKVALRAQDVQRVARSMWTAFRGENPVVS